MGQGQRQGVGGVGRGRLGQIQQALNHSGDGGFLCGAVTDDGLFYFARRDFKNVQPGLGNGRQRRAPRFPHDNGRLQILRIKQTFNHADGRLMSP